jgi:hypothetical protein
MAKPIVANDRKYGIQVLRREPMELPKHLITVCIGNGFAEVTKNFNDSAKALAFVDRAVEEGHWIEDTSGTEISLKRIRADVRTAQLCPKMRVKVPATIYDSAEREGLVLMIYAYGGVSIRMYDGRLFEAQNVMDVEPLETIKVAQAAAPHRQYAAPGYYRSYAEY